VLVMLLGGTALSGRASGAEGLFVKPVTGPINLRFAAKYYDIAAAKNRTHHGIDIAAAAGSRVRASSDGKVTFSGQTPVGLCVSILHKNGIKTTYLPMEATNVSRGDTVIQNQKIGTLAAAGDMSSGVSHLHMGAIFAGEYIDPETLLSGDYQTDLTKLIRRGNIPPVGAPVLMTAAGKISAWPVVSALVRFLSGGASLITRFWDFLGKTGSFLAKQTNFWFQTGLKFFKNRLGSWNGGTGARRLLSFPPRGFIGVRHPVAAGNAGVVVFDPSGDHTEPNSRLYISLLNESIALSIDIYDSKATVVKRLEGWNRSASGVYWSGDDYEGRIVEPGLYSVVIRSIDGSAQVILAEVRWHL
jgi:hypothetical protein